MEPPSQPPMPAPPVFSGFRPSASLLESLVHVSYEVASMEKLSFLQTRNISSTIRRIKFMSSLFEEIRERKRSIPPSSILCFTELFSAISKAKALIEDCATKSALWNLLQTEIVSQQFHTLAKDMARALDILPLGLLDLSSDVREQVELLHKQTKSAELFIEPQECSQREELFQLMAQDPHKIDDNSSTSTSSNNMSMISSGLIDCKKVKDIMWSIGLRSPSDYDEEILRLKTEICKQAGTGGLVVISNLNNLMSLVTNSKSLIFRNSSSENFRPNKHEQHPSGVPHTMNLSCSSSPLASSNSNSSPRTSSTLNIPDEFRCPITLDLMKDPVIVASGHTYDRKSVARWLNSGHHTCPKSGQKLMHTALIPNYALKSLISQWCQENNIPASASTTIQAYSEPSASKNVNLPAAVHAGDQISETRTAMEAVKMTAEFLVGKLAMGSPDIQRQAAYELRLLAKTGMDNRRLIAEAGAIPFLVTLLGSSDPRTQENAVTALLNLSILHNNKILIMAAGAIDGIIQVLRTGTAMEARENAAATIYSLSILDECKVTIGARAGAITGLLALLREGTTAGKKDAAVALFNLAVYDPNKPSVVAAGAVPLLVELLMDDKAGITDDALAMMALLCGSGEGLKEIGENKVIVPILIDLIRYGSPKGKENSISVLLGLCRNGGEETARQLLMNPSSAPSLQSLASTGSPRAMRKAEALLRLLKRYCSQSSLLSQAHTQLVQM